MIRRTYAISLHRGGYVVEEHAQNGNVTVIGADLGKFQAQALVRTINAALDHFTVDNRLARSMREDLHRSPMAARFRGK